MGTYYKHVNTSVAFVGTSVFFNIGGAANQQTAVGDNNDATYVYRSGTTGSRTFEVNLESSLRTTNVPGSATTSIPATEVVRSVTPYYRKQSNNGAYTNKPKQGIQIGYYGTITSSSSGGTESGLPGGTITSSALIYGATFSDSGAPAAMAQNVGTAIALNPFTSASWTTAQVTDANMWYRFTDSGTGVTGGTDFQTRVGLVYVAINTTSVPTVSAANVTDGTSTATFTAPSTYVSAALTATSTPTINWTFADADGETQAYYQVKVFSAAQYLAAGFDPSTSSNYAGTGQYSGTITSWKVPTALPNNTSWRAYVRLGKANNADWVWSSWVYVPFTTSYETGLTPPSLVASGSWDNTNQRVNLTLGAPWLNLLAKEPANFETGTGSWVSNNGGANVGRVPTSVNIASIAFATPTVTVTTSTAHLLGVGTTVTIAGATSGGNNGTFTVVTVPSATTFTISNASGAAQAGAAGTATMASGGWYSGVAGLAMSATGTTFLQPRSASGTSGVAVTAGQMYAGSVWVRSGAAARFASASLFWYDSTGTQISTSDGSRPIAALSTSSWTLLTTMQQAPANAAYAAIGVSYGTLNSTGYPFGNIVAGDAVYVDRPLLTAVSALNEPVVRTNLITNPSFETNTTGWNANGGATLTRIATDFTTGAACLQIARGAAAGSGAYTNTIPVAAGLSHTASAYLKNLTETGAWAVGINWLDGSSTLITSTSATGTALTVAQGWQRLSWTSTAPTNAVYARVTIYPTASGTANALTLVDGVLLEQQSLVANSTFDTDTTGWHPNNNATLARSTTSPYAGTGFLQITTSTTTNPAASSDGIVIDPAQTYTFSAYAKNISGTTRNLVADISWYDATDTYLSSSTALTWASMVAAGAWTQQTATVTPPSNAYIARVNLYAATTTPTAGWQTGFDAVVFGPTSQPLVYFDGSGDGPGYGAWAGGSSATTDANASISKSGAAWTTGGLSVSGVGIIRTDALGTQTVRGYSSAYGTVKVWDGSFGPSLSIVVQDPEVYRGGTATYTLTLVVTDSSTSYTANTYSTTVAATSDNSNWLKAIYSPSLNQQVALSQEPTFEVQEETGTFKPRGRGYTLVVSGGLYGQSGSFELITDTVAEWTALEPLLEHKGVLLWQDPYGNHRWIRLTKRSYTYKGLGARQVRVVSCGYEEVGP